MDHREAQKSQAVERYILNEMSDDERDRFEEHYFDCRDCGADVLALESMMANGRAIAHEEPIANQQSIDKEKVIPFPPRRSWAWISVAAAAVLVVIAGVLVPSRQKPSMEFVTAATFITGESRGPGAPPIELRAGVSNNLLVVVTSPEWKFPKYEFQLRKTDGKVDLTARMTAEQAKDQVTLLPRSLPAGSYILAIHGVRTDGNRPVIATYEVRVR
jgi:hypothetical protein